MRDSEMEIPPKMEPEMSDNQDLMVSYAIFPGRDCEGVTFTRQEIIEARYTRLVKVEGRLGSTYELWVGSLPGEFLHGFSGVEGEEVEIFIEPRSKFWPVPPDVAAMAAIYASQFHALPLARQTNRGPLVQDAAGERWPGITAEHLEGEVRPGELPGDSKGDRV